MLAYRILSCRLMKAITALVVVAWLASVAGAQPRQPRPWFNMTACELYAELDLFPAENKYPALISGYIRSAIDQIRERGKVDRDSKIQEASYMLVRASVLTKDHGEKYFSSPERALAQLRRDIQDGMTAMGQACDTRGPGRTVTPAEIDAQTKKAQEQAGKPGTKCQTKVYGGGAAVTVCE